MNERERNPFVEPAALVHGESELSTTTAEAGANESADAPEGTGVRVRVENFEGPLDLLLFLIKRDQVDVTNIPIAHITAQYLASIQDVDVLDLDRAGEYLLMAATLMRIKAKMLIPVLDDEEAEEELDPRAELVRRLLEYKEFKRVGESLGSREDEWRAIFRRLAPGIEEAAPEPTENLGVSLVDLFRAFRRVIESMPSNDAFELVAEEYSVDERIEVLRRECFVKREGLPFSALFTSRRSRAIVITTFLALLEMVRRGEIEATQVDAFGEIWLRQKEVYISNET